MTLPKQSYSIFYNFCKNKYSLVAYSKNTTSFTIILDFFLIRMINNSKEEEEENEYTKHGKVYLHMAKM